MVLVHVDLSEASSRELKAIALHLEALKDVGATVVVMDKADVIKQARRTLLRQFQAMGLRAGDAFGVREKFQMLTINAPFNPREREAFPAAMRDLLESGFFDMDARGTLTVSRAGQAELYLLDRATDELFGRRIQRSRSSKLG